jgi:hypothetical protein
VGAGCPVQHPVAQVDVFATLVNVREGQAVGRMSGAAHLVEFLEGIRIPYCGARRKPRKEIRYSY